MAKILVADDDKVMLDLLKTLFDLEGDTALTVSRPEEVIPLARAEHPEAILMDVHLSGGDALPILKQLKQDPELKAIPVLMTSGLDLHLQCMETGADNFILKPFRPSELLTYIHDIASKDQ